MKISQPNDMTFLVGMVAVSIYCSWAEISLLIALECAC